MPNVAPQLGVDGYPVWDPAAVEFPVDPGPALQDDAEPAQRSPADALTFATVFAALADAKGEFTGGHSERTAEIALYVRKDSLRKLLDPWFVLKDLETGQLLERKRGSAGSSPPP